MTTPPTTPPKSVEARAKALTDDFFRKDDEVCFSEPQARQEIVKMLLAFGDERLEEAAELCSKYGDKTVHPIRRRTADELSALIRQLKRSK